MNQSEQEYYINDYGNLVFTEVYHLKRGYCCGNGCKHCPYEWKMVPERRRKELLEQRKATENVKNNNPSQ